MNRSSSPLLPTSREHRDEVNLKVVEDSAMEEKATDKEMPFDFERMAQGGFRSIVSVEGR